MIIPFSFAVVQQILNMEPKFCQNVVHGVSMFVTILPV